MWFRARAGKGRFLNTCFISITILDGMRRRHSQYSTDLAEAVFSSAESIGLVPRQGRDMVMRAMREVAPVAWQEAVEAVLVLRKLCKSLFSAQETKTLRFRAPRQAVFDAIRVNLRASPTF